MVGATVDQATQALQVLGFVVDSSKTKFSTTVERGLVIRQNPADGKKLQPGETVRDRDLARTEALPRPRFPFDVPRRTPRRWRTEYGLHVTFSTLFGTSGQLVWSQSPGVGVTVQYGDTIQLFMV